MTRWRGAAGQAGGQAGGQGWPALGLVWAGLATHRHTLLKRGVCCSYTHTQTHYTTHTHYCTCLGIKCLLRHKHTSTIIGGRGPEFLNVCCSAKLNARFSANTLRCTGLNTETYIKYNLIAWCPDSELNINQSILGLGPHECHSTNAASAKICCSDDWFMELMSSGHDIILASSDRVNVNKQQFSSSLSVNFKTLQTCYDSLATPLLSIDLLCTALPELLKATHPR